MRKVPLKKGEFYHIYNRGTDKRSIFQDRYDAQRFFRSISEFNTTEPIGSIFENSFRKDGEKPFGHRMSKSFKLVDFVCYSVSQNHYHFILEPLVDGGAEKFMQKLGNGYTKYFNHKYKRSGVLFEGAFKSIHVDTNEYLLHLSVYINLNNLIHKKSLRHSMSRSSWDEFTRDCEINLCKSKDIILGQFKSKDEYRKFAEEFVRGIMEKKNDLWNLDKYIIE